MGVNTKLSKAQVKEINGEVAAKAEDRKVREDILTTQLMAKKLATHATEGLLLRFDGQKDYKDKDGKFQTKMLRYKNFYTGEFYSFSLKELLNNFKVAGETVASTLKFDQDNMWSLPGLIFVDNVVPAIAGKEEYPLVSYKGYTQTLFTKYAGEALSKQLDKIKVKKNLRPDSNPFLDQVNIITDPTKIPVLI